MRRGTGPVGQSFHPLVKLWKAIDCLGRNQKFARAWPVLDQNEVDLRVRQPPTFRPHPGHRLPIRYVRRRRDVDAIQHLPELQNTLARDCVPQHGRDSGYVKVLAELQRVRERLRLLATFVGTRIQSVRLAV